MGVDLGGLHVGMPQPLADFVKENALLDETKIAKLYFDGPPRKTRSPTPR